MINSIQKEYLKIQIQKYIRDNKINPIDLLTECLTSEKDRYTLAAEISDYINELAKVLDTTERTAYRKIEHYSIKIKRDYNEVN